MPPWKDEKQLAADDIADQPIATWKLIHKSFNVYDAGPAVPQVIKRGLSMDEAEILAQTVVKNGVASQVSIVTIET